MSFSIGLQDIFVTSPSNPVPTYVGGFVGQEIQLGNSTTQSLEGCSTGVVSTPQSGIIYSSGDSSAPTIQILVLPMSINTNAPLTVGWAIGIAVALLIGALSIAGGTYALIHSDVNDVRSDVSSLRDSSGDDLNKLREDDRQDFSNINKKLDHIADVISDLRVQEASQSKK